MDFNLKEYAFFLNPQIFLKILIRNLKKVRILFKNPQIFLKIKKYALF
jgi:hypothetical protein